MPLGIITKNTPERLTFDLSERLHGSETQHPGSALVPDTHTEKSDSWLNAFRNYYKKHTRTADHWPFRRLHGSETRYPGSARSPWYTYGEISIRAHCLYELLKKRQFPTFLTFEFYRLFFWQFFLARGKKAQSPVSKNWKSGHVRLYTVLDSLARVEVLEELHFYRSQECEYFICRLGSQDERNDIRH